MLARIAKFGIIVVLLLAVALGALYWRLNPSPPDVQAFINARVLTMNPDRDIVEAVLVRGDRIAQLGSNEEIARLIDADTVVHDLQGNTLLPGMIDAHGHFPGSGLAAVAANLNSPPIDQVRSMADIQKRLRERLPDIKAGRWLLGYGYDDTQIAEHRHPNRRDLDTVSADIPILVIHVSGHMGVVNSAGLAMLGISRDTPDPDGGEIHKDNQGEPDGLLLETAFKPVRELALEFSPWQQLAVLNYAIDDYLKQGVTTVQNGLALAKHGKSMALTSRIGLLPQRVVLWPDLHFAEALLSGEIDETSLESERLEVGAVKMQADGSIQGYTGYLSQPYTTPHKADHPEDRGYPTIQPDVLQQQVLKYHRAGRQLAIHANGDAAIDLVLDAFAAAQRKVPVEDPRLVLVHAQMMRADQFQRARQLGVTPSFFNAHVWYWGDRHRDIFMGPQRAASISPLAAARDAGLRYSLHLDTPIVPMQPMRMIHAAVSRQTSGGATLGADQRISAMEALAAITIDAAWQIFQEDNRGSIEPGKWADLVVLDGDPLGDPDGLMGIEVVQTLVGGVSKYHR